MSTRKTSKSVTTASAEEAVPMSAASEVEAEPRPVPAKSTGRRSTKQTKSLSSMDPNELVELSSCFVGTLIYVSRSGYSITWSEFGDVHLVPVSELIKMRNEQPAFFSNHWVYPISDNAQDVIESLQLERYYKGFEGIGSLDELFDCAPEKMVEVLRNASDGVKENVARRAAQLVANGDIDSIAIIDAVEKATGLKIREQA